jgi:hypothetical protein
LQLSLGGFGAVQITDRGNPDVSFFTHIFVFEPAILSSALLGATDMPNIPRRYPDFG